MISRPHSLRKWFLRILFTAVVPAAPASAQAVDPFLGCENGVFAKTGASWVICMPDRLGMPWNGDLIIYAHGYVTPFPDRPPEIPLDQYMLPGGESSVPATVNGLGYAFATTSFRTNGLAVKDGVADIMDLWGWFKAQHPLRQPSRTFLFGVSEGGLIVTKAIEGRPAQFAGGVAACGPIGDFRTQVNYVGDVRVVFDDFFHGMLPPTAIEIPQTLMAGWPEVEPIIGGTVATNPVPTAQLLGVTGAAVDPAAAATAVTTVLGVLWYNVYATNDANIKMGGNPYENTDRTYVGSLNDALLNATVARYEAERNALASIQAHYQTTGKLKVPLITLHNTLDPIVPYGHEILYGQKVEDAGSSGLYLHIPAPRYGHCNFTIDEILAALNAMIGMSGR